MRQAIEATTLISIKRTIEITSTTKRNNNFKLNTNDSRQSNNQNSYRRYKTNNSSSDDAEHSGRRIRPNLNKDRSSYKCFKCSEVGHLIRDCSKDRAENVEAVALLAESNYSGSIRSGSSGWILDSGAMEHMTSMYGLFN